MGVGALYFSEMKRRRFILAKGRIYLYHTLESTISRCLPKNFHKICFHVAVRVIYLVKSNASPSFD